MSAVPTQSILLTGASGFVGAHVLRLLLASTSPTYTVNAPLRSQSKVDQVSSAYPQHVSSGQLRFSVVPDITAPGAFDEAFKKAGDKVDAVVHIASPYTYSVENTEEDMLKPAVRGTLEILEAAKRKGTVKKVVITSSFAAINNKLAGGPFRDYSYTAADWNPWTYEEAKDWPAQKAYSASKKLAEKAAWDFLEKEELGFDLVTLCPPMIYGPPAPAQGATRDNLNASNAFVAHLLAESTTVVPPTALPLSVDVRDVALAHVRALSLPAGQSHRLPLHGYDVFWTDVVRYLRSEPEFQKAGKTWPEETEESRHNGPLARYDAEEARKLLGLEWTDWKKSIGDTVRAILSLP